MIDMPSYDHTFIDASLSYCVCSDLFKMLVSIRECPLINSHTERLINCNSEIFYLTCLLALIITGAFVHYHMKCIVLF